MAWKFQKNAIEFGELSSKISVCLLQQRKVENPRAHVFKWGGETCIRPIGSMELIVPRGIDNQITPEGEEIMRLYRDVFADEMKRGELIRRSEEFGATVLVGYNNAQYAKTRVFNLTLLNVILGRCSENGFNYFVCGHSPDYETKSKEENEIVRAAFEQYCRAHDYMMDAAQKRFMESLKVAA